MQYQMARRTPMAARMLEHRNSRPRRPSDCRGASAPTNPPVPITRRIVIATCAAFAVCLALGAVATAGGDGTPEHVTANGSYQTSFEIPVPPAPAAPKVFLTYDSAASGSLAGIGWDLSVGWPASIVRDIRFGTLEWKLDSPWLWGSAPLVPKTP